MMSWIKFIQEIYIQEINKHRKKYKMLLIIFFLIIIIYGMNFNSKNEFLTLEKTIKLKGICAIEILIGHIGLFTGSKILFPFKKSGVLVVGLFFFFSGYGLTISYMKKGKKYLSTIYKRIASILFPAIIAYILYVVLEYIVGFRFNIIKGFFLRTNWYVFEIIVIYILFFFLLKYFNLDNAFKMITLVLTLFIVIGYYLGIDNPWYGSTICFPLGVFYAMNEEKIVNRIKYNSTIMLLLFFTMLLSIGVYSVLGRNYFISNVISRNLAALSFCLLTVIITTKISIGNKLTFFLGKISYEIYLVHLFILNILRDLNINGLTMSAITVILTFILAIILHKIRNIGGKMI